MKPSSSVHPTENALSTFQIVSEENMSTELPESQDNALAVADPVESANNLLGLITKVIADPRVDIEKMSRLLDMHERIVAEQRKVAFMSAMARLQEKLPQIEKYGKGKNSRYA